MAPTIIILTIDQVIAITSIAEIQGHHDSKWVKMNENISILGRKPRKLKKELCPHVKVALSSSTDSAMPEALDHPAKHRRRSV